MFSIVRAILKAVWESLLTIRTDSHSSHTSGAEHSSVSDKKSIALWYSGLMRFGRRKGGAGRVDTVPALMRFAVMWHAVGRLARHGQSFQTAFKAGENKWIGV